MKDVRVILSEDAKKIYNYLNKEAMSSKIERSILNAINQKIQFIKLNPHYGNPIAKRLFPKIFIKKYGITNLFRIELPNFWRMLYTLEEGETKIEIVTFVLEICNHKKYNLLFGYN
ncbi:MAG: hypothetical protein U9Q06_03905 [Nanoarchaeota archaeon]|nr:hypothetical protein [Nanoarchaeota archaeon]